MARLQKIGAVAAAASALVGGAALYVAFGLIGIDVLMDRSRFITLAMHHPAPIIVQDLLKFATALATGGLLVFFHRWLQDGAARTVRAATGFGVAALFFLLANASLSLLAVSAASGAGPVAVTAEEGVRLNSLIGLLALAFLSTNGIWHLLVHRAALRLGTLPKGLCRLGMVIGILSLIPVLGPLAGALSIVWSAWLCRFLLREERVAAGSEGRACPGRECSGKARA